MRRVLLGFVVALAACSQAGEEPTTTDAPATTQDVTTTQPEGGFPFEPIAPQLGADGNQVWDEPGPFEQTPTRERPREARVVRVDFPTDAVVAITYDDGEVRLMGTDEMKVRSTLGATGVVYTDGPGGVDILAPLPDQAPHGRPAVLAGGQIAYVTQRGELVVWDDSEIARVDIDALPDSDVVVDGNRLLVLTAPTNRYPHAILGDDIEAGGFAIATAPSLEVTARVAIEEPAVIEGRRAIWADFDGDGTLEVQVTVSDGDGGARLVVFEESGEISTEGAAVGRGSRWRHQIAFGNFGGAQRGVEVVTPHIGGIVSFHEYDEEISRVARRSDFTSHAIGSRELEGGVAIDMDGDGDLELVIPTQDRRELVAIGLEDGEAVVEWRAGLGGRVSSNIAVGMRNGVPTIAVGVANGTVYFWSAAG
mgnify:CR=1 FL=1